MNSSPAGIDTTVRDERIEPPETVADVDSLSHDGRGVARVDGKAVFIEGALPQERVRLRYVERHSRYDVATLVEILSPSPARREPPCPHFGVCGGCGLQHLAADAQLLAKQNILSAQLKRIGKVEPQHWLAPLAGPEWGYRRRARLGVRNANGDILIGFRERKSSSIADLYRCLVLDPVLSDLIPALHELVKTLSRSDHIPQIEVAVGDHARALVFRHLVSLTADDKAALTAFGKRHALQIYLQADGPETATALWPTEPALLDYALSDGSVLQFLPTDFIQVNGVVNNLMIEQAVRLLDPKLDDTVLDLFSGLGNFTLPLARRAKRVLAIEGEPRLVERGRRNAARNNLSNIEFRAADLYATTMNTTPWENFAFDKLLLDPPRGGAIEALKAMRDPLPKKIVYVSCHPGTLARDSEYLVHVRGYRLNSVGVMDMFPHTNHVESMALFERE